MLLFMHHCTFMCCAQVMRIPLEVSISESSPAAQTAVQVGVGDGAMHVAALSVASLSIWVPQRRRPQCRWQSGMRLCMLLRLVWRSYAFR